MRSVLKGLALLAFFTCARSWLLQAGRRPSSPLSLRAFEPGRDGSFSDSSDVKEVLDKIFESLKPVAGNSIASAEGAETDLTLKDVEAKFNQILADVKSSVTLTEMEKRMIFAETSLTLTDAQEKDNNAGLYAAGLGQRLASTEATFKTSIVSQSVSPVVLVCGPGPVGSKLLELGKSLGKSAAFRFLDAEQLSVLQEREIVYAIKDARAIVIAGDSAPGSSKPFVIDAEKSVKRLLNLVMTERNKSPKPYDVKIVALAQACKQPKSFMSLLGGEGGSDLESEIILLCQKRQLGYAIVKVGVVVPDNDTPPLSKNVKQRSVKATAPPISKDEEPVASFLPDMPIVFTPSRVEASEYTRASVAVEALLRASTHPQTNSSISVLSADNLGRMPTDLEWDDEFLRIEGPELERIPLRFASEMQIVIKVGRIAKQLLEPKSGLITPIEVQRFANGARILFKPRENGYLSSKEEKLREGAAAEVAAAAAAAASKSRYVSPEMEEKLSASVPEKTPSSATPKKKMALEGGLEIIVDSLPYRRVRIRRCNMGPQTIVKEESEALILKALLRGVAAIEKDYSKMLRSGL